MKQLYITLSLIFFGLTVFAQSNTSSGDPSDTANYPYWIEMMQNQNINFHQTQRAFNLYFAHHDKGKGSGWKQFKRWEAFWETRVNLAGEFPAPTQNIDAYHQFFGATSGPVMSSGGSWTNLGPIQLPNNGTGQPNGLGRVNCIAFHPTNQNIIYVGAPSGGLWKSTNGGSTWTPLTDGLPSLGISSILIDSLNPNIIYIGTGDRDAGDAPGLGVYKSTNGGTSWSAANSGMGNRTVGMMVMHPTNHNIILAATSHGIYKTTNGGSSWSQVSTSSSHFKDIKFKPGDPTVVYAVRSNAFYRSTNTGDNWIQVTSGLPTSARFVIGVTPANANYVYLVAGASNGYVGTYLSTNSGSSFTQKSSSPNILGYSSTGNDNKSQYWYDLCVAVDPSNANTLYVGGINIWKSTNGGTSWSINAHWVGTGAPAIHADQHWLGFSPLSGKLYVGNDGGIYYTSNGGSSWQNISSGLAISQIYDMGQSASSKNLLINGYQDNGTAIYRSGNWSTEIGGDGMNCIIDPVDTNYMYGALYYGNIRRSTNSGSWFSKIADDGTNGINESGAWVTPYTLKYNNPNTMFIGYKNVWRSTNVKASGASNVSWTKISTFGNSTSLKQIESCKADANILYVSRGSDLFRSDNAASSSPTWTTLSAPGYVSDIETHPTNPNIVYVTAGTNIYKSTNKGASWTSIKGNLPNTNMNTLVYDTTSNEGIYVGTDIGVFYKNASMPQWVAFSTGLPAAAEVTDLEIYYGSNAAQSKLRAATFGRGQWSSDLYSPPNAPPSADFSATSTTPCQGSATTFNDLSTNTPTSWSWSFSPNTVTFVSNTSASSQNPVVQFNAAGSYTVQLIASNQYGSDTVVKTNYITVGTPYTAPVTENFEQFTTGNPGTFIHGWTFSNTGAFNWRVNSGNTPTVASGPNFDHTTGSSTGKYLYTEASSPAVQGEVANLISPCVAIPSGTSYNLTFWYHMYGNNITGLHVDILHNGTWTNDVYTINGQQQTSNSSAWLQASVSMSSYAGSTIKIRFRVIRGTSYNGDVAIDDVAIGSGGAAPVADFTASAQSAIVGQTITFADLSTNSPNSWAWSFSPSTVSFVANTSASSQNPHVIFNSPGQYSVTLIASNSSGSDTLTKTNYITVTAGASLPFSENFETFTVGTPGSLANGWTSTSSGGFNWTVNSGGTPSNYTGPIVDHTLGTAAGKYLYTEASVSVNNQTAELISPAINLISVSNAELQFWYHMYGAAISALRVDVEYNGSWINNVHVINGQQQTSNSAPWQQATVNLQQYTGSVVKIRFRVIHSVTSNYYQADVAVDDVVVQQVTPPANDDPCGATLLTVSTTCSYTTSSNINATNTSGVPNPPCGGYAGKDVWFKAVAPASGYLTIDCDPVPGSFNDGAMAAYKGSCGNLTYLACNDDYQGNGTMPHLALSGLTGGDTIFVRFWKYSGNGTGQFKICMFEPPYLTISPLTQNVSYVGGNTTYQVSSNQSWTATDNASWVTISPASGIGNGTITATYSGNAGSPRTATITVSSTGLSNAYATLQQSSPVMASFTQSTTYFCKNSSATFTNTSTNNTSNQWYIDGSAVSTSTNLTHTFTTIGSHVVKLVVSNGSNSDSTQSVVFVSEPPTANAGSDITVCEGGSVSLNANVSLGINQCTTNCNMPTTCASHSNNDSQEYITKVELNGSVNISANQGPGYQDFTSNLFTIVMKDSVYYLHVTGHTGGNWVEYCDAFIDWNRNGLFDEPAISMGSAQFNGDHVFTGLVSAPSNMVLGKTKMRVIMRYGTAISSGCLNGYGYGETEDYMIEIVDIDTVNYSWSGPNNYTATGINPLISNIPLANNGTYTLTVSDDFGCSDTDTKTITVNAKPNATFASIADMCIDAQPLTLTQGSPSGGTYSGTGVSNGVFNPATAGAGTHTLYYSVTNSNGCSDTANTNVTVHALPTVTLATFNPACINGGSMQLTGGSPSGGTYSGTGVSNGFFNPATAGLGTKTITYSYTDANGCSNTAQNTITVNAAPTVTLSSYSPLCSNSQPLTLSGGSPAGGSYSGTGVSNGQFNPSTAGTGSHTITYVYTNSNACSDTATSTITVNAAPIVTFSALSPVCANAPSFTLSGGSPAGGSYSGQGVLNGSFTPMVGAGSYPITYTYTNSNNCSDTAVSIQTVNPLPTVNFSGLPTNMCANAPSVTLTGSPIGGSFSGSGMTGSTFSPSTAGAGTHSITYSYTDNNNCSNSTSHSVTVHALPVVNAGSDASVSYGATATLSGTISGQGSYSHNWSPASMVSSPTSLTTQTVALTSSQIFTLTASETNSGCSDSDMVTITVTGGPLTLNVSSSASTICAGDSVQLTALAGGGSGTYSYSWTFNGTVFSTTGNPVITPTNTGYYKVTVSDANNNLADSVFITVNPLPTVTFSGLPGACEGDSLVVLYGGQPAGGTYSGVGVINGLFFPPVAGVGNHQITYTFTNSNGCANSAVQVLTVHPKPNVTFATLSPVCSTTPVFTLSGGSPAGGSYYGSGVSNNSFNAAAAGLGTHSIKYVYTDANSCTDSATSNITVNSAPVANAGSDQTVNSGATASLSGSASGGSGSYSYSWSPASMVVNAGMQNTSTVALSTTTEFQLNVFDTQTSCSDSDKVLITVSGGALTSTVNASAQAICVGDSVQLTVLASGGSGNYTYSWTSSPAGFASSLYNPVFYPTATTTFYVTVSDGTGQTSGNITVNVSPQPAVNLGNDTTVCNNASLTLDAGAGFSSYLWSTGSSSQSISVNTASLTSGPHLYSVMVSNGICYGSDSIVITKDNLPYVNLGPDDTICKLSNKVLDAGFGYSHYQWSTGDTTQIIILNGSTLGVGTHSISVSVTSAYGCSNSDEIKITVDNCQSIREIDGGYSVKIYPNPSKGRFNIKLENKVNDKIMLDVINLQGAFVKRQKIEFSAPQTTVTIDLSTLPKGVYLMRLSSGKMLRIERIVIQ